VQHGRYRLVSLTSLYRPCCCTVTVQASVGWLVTVQASTSGDQARLCSLVPASGVPYPVSLDLSAILPCRREKRSGAGAETGNARAKRPLRSLHDVSFALLGIIALMEGVQVHHG